MSNALLLIGGFVVLVLGAELLVRGASRLAAAAGMPPLIIGLTIVAFGTSAPEMAVSVGSAMRAFTGTQSSKVGVSRSRRKSRNSSLVAVTHIAGPGSSAMAQQAQFMTV